MTPYAPGKITPGHDELHELDAPVPFHPLGASAIFVDGWTEGSGTLRISSEAGKAICELPPSHDGKPHLMWTPASRPAPAGEADTQAARDVLAERRRQVQEEGWTPEHDNAHDCGQMAQAAAAYALSSTGPAFAFKAPHLWPFDWRSWKPSTPRRELVKAGALILAEIERLDRAALTGEATR